jgi:hypothetical protein
VFGAKIDQPMLVALGMIGTECIDAARTAFLVDPDARE